MLNINIYFIDEIICTYQGWVSIDSSELSWPSKEFSGDTWAIAEVVWAFTHDETLEMEYPETQVEQPFVVKL